MKKRDRLRTLISAAMCLAIAFVLPFFTGQIKEIGSMLCLMHIPVLLCGFFCGAPWGMLVGFIAPMLRSIIIGMPMMFPTAICMAFELAAYGLIAGWLHRILPKKNICIYVSLVSAMVMGRLVWGIAMLGCLGFDNSKFGWSAFLAGSVLNAVPGIVLQIVFIPVLVMYLSKKS